MSDDQPGEDLDDDITGDAPYPPEHPQGAEAYGTTAAEEATGEPLAERVAREEPEVSPVGDEAVVLVAPDEGVHADVEGTEVATAVPAGDTEPLSGDPSTGGMVQEQEGAQPAEEAAIHIDSETP